MIYLVVSKSLTICSGENKVVREVSLEKYFNILSIVRSESMIPSLQVGDILISHPMPFVNNIPNSEGEKGKLLRIGDIILLQVWCIIR